MCGDNVVNSQTEECDGTDDSNCAGLCQVNCQCASCGDGIVNQPTEDCDGADDTLCPGLCTVTCTCEE